VEAYIDFVLSSVLKVVKAMQGDPPPSNRLGNAKVIIRRAKWWKTKRGKNKVGGRMVHDYMQWLLVLDG